MVPIQSSGNAKGSVVYWMLDRHRIEFTRDEFREMVGAIQSRGLFAYLLAERPALHSQLVSIVKAALTDVDESEIEFILEQALLNLNSRI